MSRRGIGRRIGAGIAGTMGACALILAILTPGVDIKDVDLNDGGVWVTNAKRGLVAHVNVPARLMDSAIHAPSESFDVFQDGEKVQVSDAVGYTLAPVDPGAATLGTAVEYTGYTTAARGGSVVITDAATGSVWVQDVDAMSTVGEGDAPTIKDIPGAVTTIGLDGSVHAVSAATGKVVSHGAAGTARDGVERTIEGLEEKDRIQIAAIGSRAVVLDQDTSTLYLPGGASQKVEGEGLVLQDSGPEADVVLLASQGGIIRMPIEGGAGALVAAQRGGGNPTRPVMHNDCAYGAWSVSGAFVRDCPIDADDKAMVVDTLASAEKAVFRVNRDVIVLNDIENDGLWLPDSDMVLVDNWDQIESKLESEKEDEEDSIEDSTQTLLPDRTKENVPPVAEDDDFGVRAGRTTILPVLMNDSDTDGDFLTASPVSQPSIGQVTVAREGAALQIQVEPGTIGAAAFDYEVSDGRGGTARARVTVSVHGDDVNAPPEQKIVPAVALGAGRSATVNALTNWVDPDGDPFYLSEAFAPDGLTVRSHESGSVEIKDVGHPVGKDEVVLHVSDGRDVGEGKIDVTIKDSGNEPPLANADHLIVREGASAVISPMANDSDPNGDALRLVQIEDAPVGITAVMDATAGTVSVEGQNEGIYYLTYVVTDGPATAAGVIRVDVVAANTSLPPSAEDDLAVLPEGGQALVDLIANDSDPTGGVLTVQKLDIPANSPLVVALVDHHLARITAPGGLNGPETFTYSVSNGVATASSTVTVLPRPAQSGAEPPELNDDALIVRSGDIGSVAVLANDRSPSSLKLMVMNNLQHEIPADVATVFMSNNIVRVRGGATPGSGRIIYTVTDTFGNVASATINLTVVAVDEAANTAPTPKDITARAVAGQKTTIQIPLDGIDAEGDSVSLVGVGTAPKLGTAIVAGSTFEYTPGAEAKGTDSFTYVVTDALGRQATGRIRVGVAPKNDLNHDPVAVPDVARVRPNTKVSVAVTANDIDPDGDRLALVDGSTSTTAPGVRVAERAGRVIVTAPAQEGTFVVSYKVEDGVGGSAEGTCTVAVTANAPLLAPITRDDEVTLEQVQASANGVVSVDVLANDEDPDGDIQDDTVSSSDPGVRVVGSMVEVDVQEAARKVVYSVTDPDGQVASAVITVPGTVVTLPILDTRTLPIRVKAGESKTIDINDHIVAREGRTARLTNASKVSAGIGWDGSTLVSDETTLTFRALEDFSGPTSITLEVTDGADLADPSGAVTTLSLPVEVEGIAKRPPRFAPTAIQVAPGEDAVTSNLASWVSDPDGDDPAGMTYRLTTDVPTGITASISGTTLSVVASADTAKGNAGTINIEVTDQSGQATTGTVPITVAASSRPLAQTSPAEVTLNAGQSETIDISQYATNPFADRGPLAVLGGPTVSEGGSATVSGTQITVKANEGFHGTFTVTYRVQDATKDPAREVQGTITATVRDKPGAPIHLTAESNTDSSAFLKWTAPGANGSPITGYTVKDLTQGDEKDCGLRTECLFDGRDNGKEHAFVVTATNVVGVSEPSNEARAMIDIVPEPVPSVSVDPGDGRLTVSWTAATSRGSSITTYKVRLSPGDREEDVPVGTTSHTFAGLSNGGNYRVSVAAVNDKGESTPVSRDSIPYGAPGAPTGVAATISNYSDGARPSISVTWNEASPSGRAIERYYVYADGQKILDVPGTTNSGATSVGYSSDKVRIAVVAVNDLSRPDSHTSEPGRAEVWVLGQPLAPSVAALYPTGNDGEATLKVSASPAGQGWTTSDLSLQWRADGGDWRAFSGETISGLSNGADHAIEVRSTGSKGGQDAASAAVKAGTVNPYGPPIAPKVTCQPGGVGVVECSWSGASGNGRDGNSSIALTGSAEETVPLGSDGKRSFNVGEGGKATLCVDTIQTSDEKGTRVADGGCADATAPHYKRNYDGWRHYLWNPTNGTCAGGCRALAVSLWDWPPNSSVHCWIDNWTGMKVSTTVKVNDSGTYEDVPVFSPTGKLATGLNSDADEVRCEGGTHVSTPDRHPNNE